MQKIEDRYLAFKDNYIELDKLLDEIKEEKIKGLSLESYEKVSKKYNELLRKVENHKTKDFLKVIIERNLTFQYNISLTNVFCYYIKEFDIKILQLLLILLPIIGAILYFAII